MSMLRSLLIPAFGCALCAGAVAQTPDISPAEATPETLCSELLAMDDVEANRFLAPLVSGETISGGAVAAQGNTAGSGPVTDPNDAAVVSPEAILSACQDRPDATLAETLAQLGVSAK